MKENSKIWIIGGSSGIGLEIVKLLLEENHKIIVSSRDASKQPQLIKLSKEYPNNIYLLNLDVNSHEFKGEIKEAWNVYNGIDLWFYNVGDYEIMSINEWNKENFIKMNTTNYLGVVKLMIDILPYFKEQKYGKWVWNLSLSSYFGLPKGGGYSAPKAALLNLAQSIQPELDSINIKLQLINHGFVKTRLTEKNDFPMPQLMGANFAARKIVEQIKINNSFEISFPFLLSMFLKTLNLLPYKLSLAITKKLIK